MNKILLPDERPYRVITEASEARRAVEQLQGETLLGLDTETFWEAGVNHSRVSLVQLAPREGEVLVIDALAVGLEILRPVIESPEVMMAAHNARFDEGMLISEGLQPAALVDTLRLARTALRLPSYSLAGVSAHLFGIELDKRFQKSNWRQRPLTRAQLDYAATDAHVALRVYEELQRILTEQGRFADALRFAKLAPTSGSETTTPRKRRAPLPPLRPLTAQERAIIRRLKKWRLDKSFEQHVPAYMVCPDRTLEHLVIEQPRTLADLNAIHGLGASRIERYGEELLELLRQATDEQAKEE